MLKKEFSIKTPAVPNFIRVGESNLSIADFSEAELTAIGTEWTKDLISAARAKRKAHKTEPQTRTPNAPV